MKKVFPLLIPFLLAACTDGDNSSSASAQPVVANFEGEYRKKGGEPQFMVCSNRKVYQLIGHPKAMEDLNISYDNFVVMPEDPVKMWMEASLRSLDIHNTGIEDSVLVLHKLLHMTPDHYCPTAQSKELSGRYEALIEDGHSSQRELAFELFQDGMVIMYTKLNGKTRTFEEEGRWGLNSKGTVIIEWSRRGQEMTFSESNGILTSLMAHKDDVRLRLKRTAAVSHPTGYMHEVIDILKTVSAPYVDTTGLEVKFNTRIDQLLPDSVGLSPIYDQLSERYGVKREKLDINSVYFENAKDVLNFVRYSTPKI